MFGTNFISFVALVVFCLKLIIELNFFSSLICFQAVRIAPVVSNSSNETVYESFTFDLSTGTSEASTSVTIPPELLAEIARSSGTEAPVIHATVLGEGLSLDPDQDTSQVSRYCLPQFTVITEILPSCW